MIRGNIHLGLRPLLFLAGAARLIAAGIWQRLTTAIRKAKGTKP